MMKNLFSKLVPILLVVMIMQILPMHAFGVSNTSVSVVDRYGYNVSEKTFIDKYIDILNGGHKEIWNYNFNAEASKIADSSINSYNVYMNNYKLMFSFLNAKDNAEYAKNDNDNTFDNIVIMINKSSDSSDNIALVVAVLSPIMLMTSDINFEEALEKSSTIIYADGDFVSNGIIEFACMDLDNVYILSAREISAYK